MEENTTLLKTKFSKTGAKKPTGRFVITKKTLFVAGFVLAFVIVSAIAVYASYQLHKMKDPVYQQKMAEQFARDVVNQVGKLIELPAGTPQVITVDNADTIKNSQPFFEKAINGDQILVYPDQAILYRPNLNKIINIGTVNKTPQRPQVEDKTEVPGSAADAPEKK